MDRRIPPHYLNQTGWEADDFNSLNAYLNRLFLYESDPEKSQVIAQMDLKCMSRETIALIGAILTQYGKLRSIPEKYPNLKCDELTIPLKSPLYLNERPLEIFPAYRNLNIHY